VAKAGMDVIGLKFGTDEVSFRRLVGGKFGFGWLKKRS
jgi:hypothetical protein